MVIELAQVRRAGKVESIHYGYICLLAQDKQIHSSDANEFSCFTRSIIKPIQAKIALDILGDELSDEDLAIGSASHLASEESLTLVKNLLSKFNNQESLLKCGIFTESNKQIPSKLHHNCSGKHSLLLAACKKRNWSVQDYDQLQHPLQQAILNELKKLTGRTQIYTGIDGCSLPTFYLSLQEMTLAFANLSKDPGYQRIIMAMNKFPFIIGGPKQIDSLLMHQYPNQFLAKGGAEGLMIVTRLKCNSTIVIKIIDGSSRAKNFITKNILESLNWIEKDSIKLDSKIYNSNQTPIGEFYQGSSFYF